MKLTKLTLIFLTSLFVGCNNSPELKATANALLKSSENCLLQVRDNNLKYDDAPSCIALDALSMQFVEAGGFRESNPLQIQLISEQSRTMAWTALAISESDKRPISLRIW